MTESRKGTRPSPSQRRARQERAEAQAAGAKRKARTRNLIELGGVAAAFGFDSPEQLEEILAALTRSAKGSARLRKLGVKETARWPD